MVDWVLKISYWTRQLFSLLISTLISWTGCKKLKTMQERLFFTNTDMETLDHFSGTLMAASQRKDHFQDSHLCFPILWLHPATIPVIMSLCALCLILSVLVLKKDFHVRDGSLRALVTGRSLFKLSLSGTTFLLTTDTAVLSSTVNFS